MHARNLYGISRKYEWNVWMRIINLESLACMGCNCEAGRMHGNHKKELKLASLAGSVNMSSKIVNKCWGIRARRLLRALDDGVIR